VTNPRFTWDEGKRRANLRKHGLDFRDAAAAFNGVTVTYEDDQHADADRRFITLGILRDTPVSIVHTETTYEIRIISFRKANRREAALLFGHVQD